LFIELTQKLQNWINSLKNPYKKSFEEKNKIVNHFKQALQVKSKKSGKFELGIQNLFLNLI